MQTVPLHPPEPSSMIWIRLDTKSSHASRFVGLLGPTSCPVAAHLWVGDLIMLPVPGKGHGCGAAKAMAMGLLRLHQARCKQCWASLASGQCSQMAWVTHLELKGRHRHAHGWS